MRQAFSILAPFLIAETGCLSAPVPQELVDVGPPSLQEPLFVEEGVRLSRTGISREVILELIRNRGIADRSDLGGIVALGREGVGEPVILVPPATPPNPPERKPAPGIVYRDLFIPLWPSYSRGHWHWGLRVACYSPVVDKEVQEIRPYDSVRPEIPPRAVDP
jgi:hypothetical protein